MLDHGSGRLLLKELGSTGSFTITGERMDVRWDKYPPEVFYYTNGSLLQSKQRDFSFIPKEWNVTTYGVTVICPNTEFTAELRTGDSDVETFRQVFINEEYNIEGLPSDIRVIVDLGANIGLSALYFASRYPDAKILAVEPDRSNFVLLRRNTMQIAERCETLNAAIWGEDTELLVKTHTEDGRYLGGWGVQTIDEKTSAGMRAAKVEAVSMTSLKTRFRLDKIDILKVDIEGAEFELFSLGDLSWLDSVRSVVVETHERFRPGSHKAVLNALAAQFTGPTRSGENYVFNRV